MIYKMSYNVDRYEIGVLDQNCGIFARESNIASIKAKLNYDIEHAFMKPDFKAPWPDIEFYYNSLESDVCEDLLLNCLGWPIISRQTKELLDAENISGLVYYPVKLIDKDNRRPTIDYYLLYVNSFIDAYDMEKSQYKYIPKYDLYSFVPMKIVFNKDLCDDYDVFRSSLDPAPLYTSKRIKDIINDNNLTGFAFLRVF